jgi:dipeptidase D
MGKEINSLEPRELWSFFYDLTQIPRPSGNEKKVIEYIQKFADSRKLKYLIDDIGNIIVSKSATAGKENNKGVVLQAHVDMVPQKNSNKAHDFNIDTIETIIDEDWLKANETTLGADNGIGVAAMLAVLDSDTVQHGPLEALFTVNEEAGMDGAFALENDVLKSSVLLNLDSEDEGELYIGCAGGIDVDATREYKEELAPLGITHEIIIRGLKGGHSGLDINLGRANANKLMGRILWAAISGFSIKISSVRGGDLRNAIPRESTAKIVIPEKSEHEFIQFFQELVQKIKIEYKTTEPNLNIEMNPAGAPEMVMTNTHAEQLIGMLNAAKHGVVRMSVDMPGVVETSLNLAIVSFSDGNAKMVYLVRSAVDSVKYALSEELEAYHSISGCKVNFSGDYPGWRPNKESYILQLMQGIYLEEFGKTPEVKAIHAGLECGIIGSKYPEIDMISFGPTIRFPHSPDEKVKIDTVKKFWDFLSYTLKRLV